MVKFNYKSGDFVEIKTSSEKFKGRLIDSPDKKILILKLNNGYNIGIEKNKIKEIKLIKKSKQKKPSKKKIKTNPKLKTISLLHTGGTLASKVDYKTGAVYSSFTPEDILELVPELKEIVNIESRLIRNMWSDDLRFKHFSLIAKEITKEIKKDVEGIIIGMGTDNLAVASAALSFMLKDLPIPVLLVGAQRSSDRGSSDSRINLISAAKFITNSDFSGVGICMHSYIEDKYCDIFPACKTKKLHTSRRDAFRAVNDNSIARIDYKTGEIEFFNKNYQIKDKKRKVILKEKMEEKVGLIRVSVNMFAKQIECFKGFKGLVIEGTGLGHMPLESIDDFTKEHNKIKKTIKNLIKEGCIIVMCSGCLFGKVNLNVYSKGKELQELGVISGKDMLADTAFVKLSWLLGNYKKEEAKNLIGENLRGEINERIKVDHEAPYFES